MLERELGQDAAAPRNPGPRVSHQLDPGGVLVGQFLHPQGGAGQEAAALRNPGPRVSPQLDPGGVLFGQFQLLKVRVVRVRHSRFNVWGSKGFTLQTYKDNS